MADTGWLNPSSSGYGYSEWSDASLAYISDDNYATINNGDRQDFFAFNVSIPGSATINGIEVRMEAMADVGETAQFGCFVYNSSGDGSGWQLFNYITTETYESVGGSSDLWGNSWSPSDFTNDGGDFRVLFFLEDPGDGDYIYIDNVQVKIYYTESSSSSSKSVSVTKSSTSSQSSLSSESSESSSSKSISITKSSSSKSISITKSSSSISQTKSSSSISQTKSSTSSTSSESSPSSESLSSQSTSVTKSSSSISIQYETDCNLPTATGETYNEWDNPTNAYTLDSNYASMGLEAQDYYDFDFSIPKYSDIVGIAVNVNARRYDNKSPKFDVKLSWDGGSTWTAAKDTGSFLSTISSYKQVGGANDLWNRAWSTSEFSNANFRVYIEQTLEDSVQPFLNCLCVKVYYEEGSSSSSASISVTKSSSSISQTKTSSSISISLTKSSSSISQTKSSSSSSAESKSSSSISISITKSSLSSSSVSLTKSSSSVSLTKSSFSSESSSSISISVTKSSSSVSQTKSSFSSESSSSISISVTKSSQSSSSSQITKSSCSSVSISQFVLSVSYRFTDYDVSEAWATNPANMTNGIVTEVAETDVNTDTQLCDENNCPGTDYGTITKVELRAYGDKGHASNNLQLRPVFTGGDGDIHNTSVPVSENGWSNWIDITNDTNHPDWTWADVVNLDCDVIADQSGGSGTFHCGQVEIKITYTSASSFSSSLSVSITKSSLSSESSRSSRSSTSVTKSSFSSWSSFSSESSYSSSSCSCSSSSSWSSYSSNSSSSQSISQTRSSRSLTSSSSFSVTKSSFSLTKSSISSSFSLYDIGTTILKLTWDTRVVNFSDQEVNRIEIDTKKEIDLQRLQNRQPIVYELGSSYKIINVTLDAYMTPMTLNKLDAIRKVTDIMTMTMYYSDGVTQAEKFDVRINPVNRLFYEGGNRDAETPLSMVFFEANAG